MNHGTIILLNLFSKTKKMNQNQRQNLLWNEIVFKVASKSLLIPLETTRTELGARSDIILENIWSVTWKKWITAAQMSLKNILQTILSWSLDTLYLSICAYNFNFLSRVVKHRVSPAKCYIYSFWWIIFPPHIHLLDFWNISKIWCDYR